MIIGKNSVKPKSSVRREFKLRAALILTILLLWLLSVGAQAQQPFTTDDTDVPARGAFHFEFFSTVTAICAPHRV